MIIIFNILLFVQLCCNTVQVAIAVLVVIIVKIIFVINIGLRASRSLNFNFCLVFLVQSFALTE